MLDPVCRVLTLRKIARVTQAKRYSGQQWYSSFFFICSSRHTFPALVRASRRMLTRDRSREPQNGADVTFLFAFLRYQGSHGRWGNPRKILHLPVLPSPVNVGKPNLHSSNLRGKIITLSQRFDFARENAVLLQRLTIAREKDEGLWRVFNLAREEELSKILSQLFSFLNLDA